MAFTEPITSRTGGFKHDNGVFNVSNSVGESGANYWSDIQLVQYFIHAIYDFNSWPNLGVWKITEATRNDLGNLPNPNKDYKDLEKTTKWVKHFQIDGTLMNGFSLIGDGRVDRGQYQPEMEFSKTIYALNLIYKLSLEKIRINDWTGYLFADLFVPSMLKDQLRGNVLQK